MKRILTILLSVAIIISIFAVVSTSSVSAASKRTKAVRAYKSFLKQNSNYSEFSLIYLDNNKVPELLAKYGSFVNLFTFREGKVTDELSIVNTGYQTNEKFNYFKKIGIFSSNTIHYGVWSESYPKLSKGKIKGTVFRSGNLGSEKTSGVKGYYKYKKQGNFVRISKAKFKSELKRITRNKKMSSAKFFSNTKTGRKKHCK